MAYSLMQMMIVPALPAIQREMGVTPDAIAWVVSAFLLSTAVATPILGRLGDIFGKSRVLVVVLLLFAAGSVAGALATSLSALIAARVVQGLGGAIFPLAFGLARDALPPAKVSGAIALIAGSFGVGGSAGLVLTGPLVDGVSWHAVFWVGVLMPLVAVVGVLVFVPRSEPRYTGQLDWLGALLLALGMSALLVAVTEAFRRGVAAPVVVGPLVLGVIVLAVWVRWEQRHPNPLIHLRLLTQSTIWPVNLIAAMVGFGMYATGYLVPQLLQADPAGGVGFGFSVTQVSVVMLPALLVGLGASAVSGMLGRRFGPAVPLTGGVALMAVGYAVLAWGHTEQWPIYVGTILTHGIGLNFALTAMATVVVGAVPATQTGEAGGVNTMLRTVGGAVGGQVVAALIVLGSVTGGPTSDGFLIAFAACGVLLLAASVIALMLSRRR